MATTSDTCAERVHDVLRHPRRHPLEAIFHPQAVAVIGASETPGSVGRALLENLESFPGKLFPVNLNHATVLGRQAWPTIGAIPNLVDLALIATPASTVPDIMRQCADAGVRGAVIISAGFKECGPEGLELERQILAEARRGQIRVIGPNCLGVMVPRAGLNASFASRMAQGGGIAFLSQSGALCTAILDWSLGENVGFSGFVSVGSMLDVSWGDLIYHFGDDPSTKSIVIYMESVGDARSFLSAAREVALSKPILLIKAGRTMAAARAAATHTGALAGSDDVLDAAFRRVGVLRVDTIEELFDMAEVLSKQPPPPGPRLAIVTNAGGPGVLATDALVRDGGEIAALSKETYELLDHFLPHHWSHSNPVDMLGDASAACYARVVEAVVRDSSNDGLLVILTPQAMTDATGTARELKKLSHPRGKPILASWMGRSQVEAGKAILNDAGIPTFDYPDTAARAFSLFWRYGSSLRALYETPARCPEDMMELPSQRSRTSRIIQAAKDRNRILLTELESKEILAEHDIPTIETRLAFTREDAVALAARVGYPVVLKLHSETLTHKTEVGGVQLNLHNATEVGNAWEAIESRVTEKAGRHHFLGVTVQPMVALNGYELILGSSVDPQFGPVLLFGAGGQLVEILNDRALGLPPLNATLARRLMERTRVYDALKGVRGRPSVDLAALEQLLIRFSCLVVEQPWIREIDINPLLTSPERLLALDARIILHDPNVSEKDLPRPAIRPYPAQYITRLNLKDKTEVTIRPIRPEDEPLLAAFYDSLSNTEADRPGSSPFPSRQNFAHEQFSRVCFIDYDREMVLIADRRNRSTGHSKLLAVARMSKLHGTNEAEFAITVGGQWRNLGLGSALLNILIRVAHDERLNRLTASFKLDNTPMLEMCRRAGFQVRHEMESGECKAELIP